MVSFWGKCRKGGVFLTTLLSLVITGTVFAGSVVAGPKEAGSLKVKANEGGKKIPDIVATVNGTNIKGSEYEKAYDNVISRFKSAGRPIPEARLGEVKKGIIQDLINRELLLQAASSQKIAVTNEDVTKRIATFQSRFPSKEAFEEARKQQGLTAEQMEAQVKISLTIENLLKKEIDSKIKIDADQVKKYYEANPKEFIKPEEARISHILIGFRDEAPADKKKEARAKIDEVLKKAKAGEDFTLLARKYSNDHMSAAEGGDIGFVRRGTVDPKLENAAFSLKKGEISGVIKSPYGFHIIMKTDSRPESNIPFAQAEMQINRKLTNEQAKEKFADYIKTLHKKAAIEQVAF